MFEEDNFDVVWDNLKEFGINNQEKAFIFMDEVQNLPQVSQVVKYLYDHWQVKFVLTGSSSYYLRNLFPESLAGRKIVFELFPLTFEEFLVFKGKQHTKRVNWKRKAKEKNKIRYEMMAADYNEYLEFGGFPAVVLEENQKRKQKLLGGIFTAYFEKDAKNLADFRDMSKLRDLILLLIPRIGSRLDVGKLAAELSLSRETVYNYLAFLEQTYFITLLPKFSGSIDRQAAGSKKVFLCDGGVANVLGRMSAGQLFEQSVFANLRPEHKLHFYNKEGKNEIDFVVDKQVALEVKVSVSRQDMDHLHKRVAGLRIKEKYGVSLSYTDEAGVILATDL